MDGASVNRMYESARRQAFTEVRKRLEATGVIEKAQQLVYFIRASSGHIKIGIASNPKERLALLQIANPLPLELMGTVPGGVKLERELHSEFAAHRVSGEWFNPAPELLARISELLP
jgi:gamma-glutamyl:cysteine ligase YbdK (ATP-grasp superfamily)